MILKVRVSYLFIMFLFKMTKSKSSKTKQKTATLIFEGRKKMLSARQAPFKICKTRKKPNVGLLDAFSLFMSVLYTFNFAIGNHFPNRDSEKKKGN